MENVSRLSVRLWKTNTFKMTGDYRFCLFLYFIYLFIFRPEKYIHEVGIFGYVFIVFIYGYKCISSSNNHNK